MAVLLTLVVASIVGRTLWLARESPLERRISKLFLQANGAVGSTKLAYDPELITAPPVSPKSDALRTQERPATAHLAPKTPTAKSLDNDKPPKTTLSEKERDFYPSYALREWRAVVNSESVTAAEWRRYGITLALFHKPGALAAFSKVATAASMLATQTDRETTAQGSKRHRRRELANPFGHGKVDVPLAQELATWREIYDDAPVNQAHVPALRQTLHALRLGWFEHIALGQLYARAGMNSEAQREADIAQESARWVKIIYNIPEWGALFGFLALLYLGVTGLVRHFSRATPTYGPDSGGLSPLATQPPATSTAIFPVPALLFAFIVYLITHVLLGYLASNLLKPLMPALDSWSSSDLLRFASIEQYILYLPVLFVPLLVLKAIAPFDPLTGERVTLRTLLHRLGYHTESIRQEMMAAMGAYVLMLPVLVASQLISSRLFSHFHTPVNPAEFEMLAAHVPLDRLLVLITAAVCAPIVEETLFRGVLYNALRARFGIPGGIALSAAIFAIVHPTLPGGFLPIWTVGATLAILYERQRSLIPGIILHGIYNGIIMLTGFAIFSS